MDVPGNFQQQVAGLQQHIIAPGGIPIPMEGNGNNGRQQIQPQQPPPALVLQPGHPQLQPQPPRHWNGIGNPAVRVYQPHVPPHQGGLREEHRRIQQQQAANQGQMNYNMMIQQGRMLNRPHNIPVGGINMVMWNQQQPPAEVDGREAAMQRYIADQVEGEVEEDQNQREVTKRQMTVNVLQRLEAAATEMNSSRRSTRILRELRALRDLMSDIHNLPPEQLFAVPIDNRELADPPADTIGNEIAKEIDEMYRNGICCLENKGAPINRVLDEILRCGVCFLPIKRPQTLGCGHTVCSPCMENMVQMTRQREVPPHQPPQHQMHFVQGGEIGLRMHEQVFNIGPPGHMGMFAGFPPRRPQGNQGQSSTTISCPVCRRPCNVPHGGITVNYKLQEIIDRLLRDQAEFKHRPHQQYRNCSECKKEISCSYYFSCQDCAPSTETEVILEYDSDVQDFAELPPIQNVLCATCTVRQHNGHSIIEHASLTKELIEESKKRLEEHYGEAVKLVEESAEELKTLNVSTRDKFHELLAEALKRMKSLMSVLDSKRTVNWNRAQLVKNEEVSRTVLRKIRDVVTTQVQAAIETHRQANEAVFSNLADIQKFFDDKIVNCRTPDMDDCIEIKPGRGRPKNELAEPKAEAPEELDDNDIIVENIIAAAAFPLHDQVDHLIPEPDDADFLQQFREAGEPYTPPPVVMDDVLDEQDYLQEFVPEEGEMQQIMMAQNNHNDNAYEAFQNFAGYYMNADDANRPGPSGINNNIANNRVPRLRTRPPRAAVFSPSPEPSRKRHKP